MPTLPRRRFPRRKKRNTCVDRYLRSGAAGWSDFFRRPASMKALTAAEMREVDRLTTERFGISGAQLMENAGRSVAEFVLHQASLQFQSPVRSVAVLCGKGNNGGDGFVAARYLRHEIHHTSVFLFWEPAELKGDAALNFQRWREKSGATLFLGNEAGLQSAPGRIAAFPW